LADEAGSPFDRVSVLRALVRAPHEFDFHQVMRRLERTFSELPRWGEALRPSDEPVRLGQDPFLNFPPSTVSGFTPPAGERPARLAVNFLGLFGPQGPLPLHLTEYVRERIRNFGDETLVAFADLFHHRLLVLFHRAWAQVRPAVSRDRARSDRFVGYLGAIAGLGLPSLTGKDPVLDLARLHYAGRLGLGVKNPDGLRAVLVGFFGLPVAIEEFIGEWLPIPDESRFRLGHSPEVSAIGRTAVLGARAFTRAQKFRVVLGPLAERDFVRFLPHASGLARLSDIVHGYMGRELAWDLELVPAKGSAGQLRLGRSGRLSFNAVLGAVKLPLKRAHVVVDPVTQQTERRLA
jgi:type VI secretion system protein ImpH